MFEEKRCPLSCLIVDYKSILFKGFIEGALGCPRISKELP
jgi:hypothetical protein